MSIIDMQLPSFQNNALFRRTLFPHNPLSAWLFQQTGRARRKKAFLICALPES
jgi:hypothetical protein